ncbi:MAG TPA: choice-of-anchor Q domain-containing protein [Chloroflexota bacterium]|nr:choice-of-anchor Q domain-containing protein [Chloroflexota bacterium]HUM67916.1 choice-of-anchor Q domain-containing protein [Chloroflexota bacterium]
MLTRFVKQSGLILVLPTFFIAALFTLFQQSARANVLTVTNTNDSGPGSLRQAIADAVDGDLIDFDATLSGQVITLTSGELLVDKVLTIDASNLPERPTINGNNNSRLFYITATGVITINYLALTQGHALPGTDLCLEGCGGAIFIHPGGVGHIQNSHVFSNTAHGGGGGIANLGLLTLNNSLLSGNETEYGGGAIYSEFGNGKLFDRILLGNSGPTRGEAISSNDADLFIENSIISGNASQFGGGIFAGRDHQLNIINSSISNNIANQGGQMFGRGGGIFLLTIGSKAVISNTLISGNHSVESGGGVYGYGNGIITLTMSIISDNSSDKYGGGVYNDFGRFFLSEVTISDNHAVYGGGGVATDRGNTHIVKSTIYNNSSDGYAADGGGIHAYAYGNGFLSLDEVAVVNNHATGSGGGIFAASGHTQIIRSAIYDNSSGGTGGGISAPNNTLTVTNSTLSGNSAAFIGGIYHTYRTLSIINSTIVNNSPEGIGSYYSGAILNLSNSIIAYHDGYDCAAYNQQTNINNLIEDGSCSPALTGDPLLAPLADNGGDTYTHALLPGSPAIDAGDDAVCSSEPVNNYDQRGVTRPLDGNNDGEFHCDIGAFEAEVAFLSIAKSGTELVATNTPITYELVISNLSGVTLTNVIITDALPIGANYVSGGTLVGNVVSWTVSNLLPGEVITEQFVVTATETITNQHYRVSADEGYIATGVIAVVTQVEMPIGGLTAVNNSPTTLGQSTTFTAAISSGSNVTYTWAFGDGSTGFSPVVSHTYTEAGSYTAVVTARNAVSEISTETAVTIIDPAQTTRYIYLPVVIKGNISP